jgi:hypothetical protein
MASQLRHQTLVLAVVIIGVAAFGRVRTETQSDAGGLPQLTAQVAALTDVVNGLQQQVSDQANEISSLKAIVDDHTARLQFVTVAGTEMYITGANLNIRDGSGATSGTPGDTGGTVANPTGLGNLIIGYNEPSGDGGFGGPKTGSHNLVIGWGHGYSSVGGLVAGYENSIRGPYSTVTGGSQNFALGGTSSVTGGSQNNAGGAASSVSGGLRNIAQGTWSSVSGGEDNRAFGGWSSVSGGRGNHANGGASSVSGGFINTAQGSLSSVSGGGANLAEGFESSVSGGNQNTVNGVESSVSGGSGILSSTDFSWAAGAFHTP